MPTENALGEKNITTGEGGSVLTNSDSLHQKICDLRSHGITKDGSRLSHVCIAAPRADLIYRGKTTLVAGISTIDVNVGNGMTTGTFEALCDNVQCFTTNENKLNVKICTKQENVKNLEALCPECNKHNDTVRLVNNTYAYDSIPEKQVENINIDPFWKD